MNASKKDNNNKSTRKEGEKEEKREENNKKVEEINEREKWNNDQENEIMNYILQQTKITSLKKLVEKDRIIGAKTNEIDTLKNKVEGTNKGTKPRDRKQRQIKRKTHQRKRKYED